MTKLIPRDAKHEEAFMDAVWSALKADTSDLGKQQRILAAFRAIPDIDPAAIREAALREAAAKCEYTIRNIQILKSDGETYETPRVQKIAQGLVEVARQEILALIGEKK